MTANRKTLMSPSLTPASRLPIVSLPVGGRTLNKFRAIKTRIDGITFDSKAEARVYMELKLLARAGEINGLQVKPRIVIQFAVTAKEKRAIQRAAKANTLTVSQWLRSLARQHCRELGVQ